MANQIASDNFLAQEVLKQRKSGVNPGQSHSPDRSSETRTPPSSSQADIDRAQQRLSQESGGVPAQAIGSAAEAKHRLAELRGLLSESPAAAVKAHSGLDGNAFEAAMARPAA